MHQRGKANPGWKEEGRRAGEEVPEGHTLLLRVRPSVGPSSSRPESTFS